MQRVLVLEKDQETADRLITALRQIDNLSVSVVPTMREACLIVTQSPQDVAFIPLEESDELRLALRSLQPDLDMILTTADPQLILSNKYRQDFQGLLHTPLLEKELSQLLDQTDLEVAPIQQATGNNTDRPPSLARLQAACRAIGLEDSAIVQMVVLSSADHLIGYCGEGHEAQAYMVVELMSDSWQKDDVTVQMQFFQMPDYYDPRLIYSRRVAGAILSLVAEPDIPISDVRKMADKLVNYLSETRRKTAEPTTVGQRNGAPPALRSFMTFAIVWRPIKPLPGLLQHVVRDCVSEIAAEKGCRLNYLSVTATIIHMVISCPAGKTAAWIVHYLKSGINDEVQRQFGVKSSIWRKGFYANESAQPLNEAELKMLLTP